MVEVEVAHQPEGYVLVRLAGEIDMSQAVPVRQAFAQALAAGRAGVIVDLCELRFLAVAGVDWVDAAIDQLADQGRGVRVVCRNGGPVWRIVSLLGLDLRWSVHHDVSEAVARLASDGRSPDAAG